MFFSLYGSVTLVNDGVWVFDSNSNLYWDKQAYWVNIGLMTVTRSSNDYIQYSTFPTISPPALEVGTMVNYGTIEFVSGGGFNFYSNNGLFFQGRGGVIKFEFGDSNSGNVQFGEVELYGYVGVYYSAGYDVGSGKSFFDWAIPAGDIPKGDFKFKVSGPDFIGLDISLIQLVCFSKTTLSVKIYDKTYLGSLICPTGEYQFLNPGDGGADLPDSITFWEDKGSCPATADPPCGSVDIGTITGDSPAAGNVNVASLAFIVLSLICLLF